MCRTYRVGIIGLGTMGRRYISVIQQDPRWELVWLCDRDSVRLEWVQEQVPDAQISVDAESLFADTSLDVIGIFTLADVRPHLLQRAIESGKHVIAEKPLAATLDEEWQLLDYIEASDRLVTVNMFNRNAWYHRDIQNFIAQGEIGDLAILRISHQTPGLMPTEGQAPEGAPFHNCGMHYVDVARWYANSEYAYWHAQGVRMWNWPEPWWVTVHGYFTNDVVFDITQGFVYGHLAQAKTEHCGLETIGTLGIVRMSHDFRTVSIDYHGVNTTARNTGPYGGKKLDVLCANFAQSLDAGHPVSIPSPRDSVVASQISQDMLDSATKHNPPAVGNAEQMQHILEHRRELRNQIGEIHSSIII